MGFRNNGYLTVWEVRTTKSNKIAMARVSSSRKDRETGDYETDFSGWVKFIGRTAEAALKLKQKDRIVAKSVEVQNRWDKEEQKEYTDFIIWEFDMADNFKGGNKPAYGEPSNPIEEEDETPF